MVNRKRHPVTRERRHREMRLVKTRAENAISDNFCIFCESFNNCFILDDAVIVKTSNVCRSTSRALLELRPTESIGKDKVSAGVVPGT